MKLLSFLVGICCSFLLIGQELDFEVGDTLFLYEATDIEDDSDYVNVDFYGNDISCVTQLYVENPDVPQVSFQITDDKGNGELYKYDEGILYLKGFLGEDPFFKMQHKFIQFMGQVPLSGMSSDDVNATGNATAFLEYFFKELPEPFPIWGQMNGFEKIRFQLSVDYKYKNHGHFSDSRFVDLEPEEITLNYVLSVKNIQVFNNEWKDVSVSIHPDLEKILQPIEYQFFSLHDKGSGLFFQRDQVSPKKSVMFLFSEPKKYVPDCMGSEAGVYVFPNPTFGDLNLKIDDPKDSPYEFYLYDIIGNELWNKTIELNEDKKAESFLLPRLKKGLYLYAVKDSRGAYLQSRRLVVVEH